MRNKLIIALKIAISISVLITIVTRLESQQIISLLQQTNSVYLLIAMILSLLAVPVAGLRWRLLAEMLHFNISTATATRATFAGLFVGQVLPGGIGSDVIRGWMVWNIGLPNKSVIISLIADRIASLFAIGLMIILFLPLSMPFLSPKIVTWLVFSTMGCSIIGCIAIIILSKPLVKLISKLNVTTKVVLYSVGLSILAHVIMILSSYFISLAIGINSLLWMWMLIMPIIILITVAPISINGWGIRELAMVHLWGIFGISEPEAFLLSICVGVIALTTSLPGCWFWMQKRRTDIIEEDHKDYIASMLGEA